MNENINQLNENFETYQEILKDDMDYQNNNITSSNEQIKCYCGHTDYCDCGPLEEPKQETLEEAAENFVNSTRLRNYKVLFIEGAKWNQEQILQFLYSEITERRPYSSSKMCEKVIEFIEQLNTKK